MTQYGKLTVEPKVALGCHLLPAAILLQSSDFHESIIKAAISGDKGAGLALQSPSDYSGAPLYAAVWSGQCELVRRLVCGVGLGQTADDSYCLEGAVQTNDLDMIRLLLKLGAPAADRKIQCAIICSVELGHAAAARVMLDHVAAGCGDISWALDEGLF